MAPTQPCAKYQYVVTSNGPKILPVEDPSCKDEESPADYNAGGYLPVKVNDTFKNGRYRVIRKLGWGHFSTVWLVKDTQESRHSALKVVKSAGRYAETARDEIKLLSRVASFSPTHPGRCHIVSFLDSFVNQGPESSHVCIVFEPLGENLLAMIERNKKKGVPRVLVKVIAKQILLGLQYLHDECDLVHTDIKPENIQHSMRRSSVFSIGEKASNHSREGLPMKGRDGKGKASIEDELEEAASTSWKPRSWTDKISSSLSTSYKSSSSSHGKSKLCQVQSSHHSQPRPGVPSSSFWKDPGTAAPAPAVVVSVVAAADGGDESGNYFDFPTTSNAGSSTTSESSSATATIVRPSRTGTPEKKMPSNTKSPSLLNDARGVNADTASSIACALLRPSDASANAIHIVPKLNPSLLTRTAPTRPATSTSTSQRTDSRPSPPHHTSHMSARQHTHLIPCICSDLLHDHNVPRTNSNTVHTNTWCPGSTAPISPTSTTPTPAISPPSAPPPTPVESPSIASFIPPPVPASSRHPAPPVSVPISIPSPVPTPPPISIKIADLGNATPSTKHYTEDIQTRQYRAPEAILGKRDWDARADIWSVACVIFELLTAEFLFDPHGQGELFTKDDDHMAQIIELLGDFPLEIKMGGRYSRELFDHTGTLRYIHSLKPWPLKRVMMEKYLYTEANAVALADFLLPMLAIDMKQRKHARDMLDHLWLAPSPDDEEVGEW
ncbi:CMGC/SRPK protein kinase [Lyophyllum atratum]|nr:CMGC/SRPK protein kinase [Lyophyllum atratum]